MKLKTLALLGAILLLALGSQAQDLQADLRAIREQSRTELEESAGTVYTVVFDNSGSMEGERIASAKRAFQWWLGSVPAGSTWSVYNFDDGGRCVLNFTLNGQKQAATAINSFEAKTNTPICATLRKVASSIAQRRQQKPFERHVLLLFTDGEENQDKRGNRGVQVEIAALRQKHIEVVAIGYAGAGDYINGHASRYYSANDQQALQTGLAQVQSEIDVNAVIDITPTEMARLARGVPAEPVAVQSSPVEDAAPSTRQTPASGPLSSKSPGISFKWIGLIIVFIVFSRIMKSFRRR